MNKDRGIIKWMPFESLTPSKKIIDCILNEKEKIEKPTLSLEQQQEIEEKLIIAFYVQEKITIKFYQNGTIKSVISFIKFLDATYKKIVLQNKRTILFNQIIEISFS